RAASPQAVVPALPPPVLWPAAGTPVTVAPAARPRPIPPPAPGATLAGGAALGDLAAEARGAGRAVVRLPPATDPAPLVEALLGAGPALVVMPSVEGARTLGSRLRAAGWPVAVVPEGWARARAGDVVVVGARAAAWAPAPAARTVVVLDAHEPGLVETRAPAWSAWAVAAERARRAGAPCVLVTPCPALEQLAWGRLIAPSRDDERRGWARVDVVDRRRDDPRSGLLGERLVPLLRSATLDRRVVCVLNRKGRARALACRVCGRATVCEYCGGGMGSASVTGALACQRCHRERAVVCQACGSASLRATKVGVTKLRDDLEALARAPVGEVTADARTVPAAPVLIGTEAVLYRVASAAAVVLLDFDAELLAPHLRAPEDALALLARAARVAGGRDGPGRVVVQTRQPDHPVVQAAVRADPGLVATAELAVRTELQLPPVTARASVSGDPEVVRAQGEAIAGRLGVEVVEVEPGRLLVRAPDHRALCDALAAAGRPPGVGGDRLRIEVDPQRV